MNRFVRAAGTGAIVWLAFEGVAWAGGKLWRALVPPKYCENAACLLSVEHRGPCKLFEREPFTRPASPVDPEATPKA